LSIHRHRNILVLFSALAVWTAYARPLRAQELQPRTEVEAQNQAQPDAAISGPKVDENGGTNDRLFWTLPNFMTVENANHIAPLTTAQKFKLVARSSFDPVEFPYYAFLAGIGQADNSEAGYGQGALGYAKRFGSSFADGTSENFFVGAVYPSLFREDPRYFQNGKGTFLHRAGYAMTRVVLTRSDSGHTTINLSEFAGAGTAAGLSNLYHPEGDRGVSNTMSTWATQMGWDVVSDMVKEFWPDIRRKVHRDKG
jgi:hypothetical protein